MIHFCRKSLPLALQILLVIVLGLWPQDISASVYTGNGLFSGLDSLAGVGGISSATSIRALILSIIAFLLDIVLLLAVLAVIIAGIYLIVSNGDEANKDKAKKIVFYAIAGIILIVFARVIVVFVNTVFA